MTLQLIAQHQHDILYLLVFLDVVHEVLGDVFKLVQPHLREIVAQPLNSIWKQVVNNVLAFGMELVEEQFYLLSNLLIRILQQHADIYDLTPDLQHVIEGQVSDDDESLSPHTILLVVKHLEQCLSILVEQVWESVEHIAKGNDDISLNTEFNRRL